MPTGLASTMILVSLCGINYGIAVASESAALTLLNALICEYSHFQVVSVRVSFRSGSVMVAKFGMKRALYWAMPRNERSSVGLRGSVASWSALFFSGARAKPVAENVYPKNSILVLLNSHFLELTVNPDLCSLLNVLASAMSCCFWFLPNTTMSSLTFCAPGMSAINVWIVCWKISAAESRVCSKAKSSVLVQSYVRGKCGDVSAWRVQL